MQYFHRTPCPQITRRQLIALLQSKEFFALAIDGRCAAGKSTLARQLGEETGAAVIHADDFFIPSSKRADPAYSPKINLEEERFLKEVLLPLSKKEALCYGVYDCRKGTVTQKRTVPAGTSVILEGSYTLYPPFRFAYTHTIFLTISKEEQRRRILQREKEGAKAFFEKWIPLEEAYFEKYSLPQIRDFLLKL